MRDIDSNKFTHGFTIRYDSYDNWIMYNPILNRYDVALAVNIPHNIIMSSFIKKGIIPRNESLDDIIMVKIGDGYTRYTELEFDFSVFDT